MAEHFGTTADGRAVARVTLGAGDLHVAILTYGAVLQDLRFADLPFSLTIGSPDLSAYEGKMASCGPIVGPVANRIASAQAMIDGALHRFESGPHDTHLLHGGQAAMHGMVWSIAEEGAAHVILSLALPNGQGGFPGNRQFTARFDVLPPATLRLTLHAETDATTLINLANHSYWRMSDAPTTAGHMLQVFADEFLPADADVLPTGEIAPVAGTRFDYRSPRALKAGAEGLLDTNFCVRKARGRLAPVARLSNADGLVMEMASTEPGLQVFDGHILDLPGYRTMDGPAPTAYGGLALEAQFWPNAPHNPAFPDITLRPGEPWEQVTEWRFSGP